MKTRSAHRQRQVEAIAALTWEILSELLQIKKKKLPPIYFFLSRKSKGSLKDRTVEETELVHKQQFAGEGITLKSPPAAWVSDVSQVPEEASHLFALIHQKNEPIETGRFDSELRTMILHEAFGMFGSQIVGSVSGMHSLPNIVMRNIKRRSARERLWVLGHSEGYHLGQRLADRFFSEEISLFHLRKWFQMNWYGAKDSEKSLKTLYKLI